VTGLGQPQLEQLLFQFDNEIGRTNKRKLAQIVIVFALENVLA
jgi:hypothetical protein